TKSFLAEHEDLVGAIACESYAVELHLHDAGTVRAYLRRVDAVYNLIPEPAAHRSIVAVVESLKMFNSVCKKLQEDSISMKAVRLLFDKMVEIFSVA
ncbi:hypothetical protein JG688_00014149, partial [Phytophthora aleatoria]